MGIERRRGAVPFPGLPTEICNLIREFELLEIKRYEEAEKRREEKYFERMAEKKIRKQKRKEEKYRKEKEKDEKRAQEAQRNYLIKAFNIDDSQSMMKRIDEEFEALMKGTDFLSAIFREKLQGEKELLSFINNFNLNLK